MAKSAISFEKVGFIYNADTAFANQALEDLSFHIPQCSFTALVGRTGSGKSTIAKLVDGLYLANQGQIKINGLVLDKNTKHDQLAKLHRQVGMVFQFPEKQLFADTVLQDVMFGPLNLGLSEKEAKHRAQAALQRVGLEAVLNDKSPFELSGGQKRRVAIAGVLAMKPEIIILDEPTAGLDPTGQQDLMQLAASLHQEGRTILMITHQMEQVAAYCDQALVMDHGKLLYHGGVNDLFANEKLIKQADLLLPRPIAFAKQLREQGWTFNRLPNSTQDLAEMIAEQLKGEAHE